MAGSKNLTILLSLTALVLFAALCTVSYAATASTAGKSRIIDIRVGEHEKFHRLVLELTSPAEYSLRRQSGIVSIRLRDVELGISEDKELVTPLLELMSAEVRSTGKGSMAVVDITVKKGVKVGHYTYRKPYRIIIDIYKHKETFMYKIDAEEFTVKIPTPEKANKQTKSVKKLTFKQGNAENKSEQKKKRAEKKSGFKKKTVKNVPVKGADNRAAKKAAKVVMSTLLSSRIPDTESLETALNEVTVKKDETAKHETVEPETQAHSTADNKAVSNGTGEPDVSGHESAKQESAKSGVHARDSAGHAAKDEVTQEPRGVRAVLENAVEKAASLSGVMVSIGRQGGEKQSALKKKSAVLSIKQLVREEAQRELIASRAKTTVGTLESLIAYNEGWRFVYRNKVNKIIQAELYKENIIEWKAFKDELSIAAFEPAQMVKEATVLSGRLAANGKVGRAAVVEAIANMIETGTGSEELEGLLRIYPDTGLTNLGWLFLGGHYEKNGFYPEALAHYARIVNEGAEGDTTSAAHFARARLLYLTGEFTKSKVAFRELLATGYLEAGPWLANAYHMRGEADIARRLYEKYVPVELDTVDPITLMGVGDLRLKYGDYVGAAEVFKGLQEKYPVDEVALSFLRVREADALVLNGEPVKAQVIYTGAYKAFRGEASVLSGLALADSMAMIEQGDSLMMAESFYHRLHRGRYVASQYAHLNMARVQLRLNLHRDAAIALDEFLEHYPTNAQRGTALEIKAEVMFEWIKKLFAGSDYFGVAEAVSRHGAEIPFGKKGSTYYRIGKSYSELSLLSEAVSALNASIDIGVDRVAERAMIELLAVYLKQKEVESVERLARNFKARFPKSSYKAELDTIVSKAAYLKGDYKAYAQGGSATGEPAVDFNRATALARLNRHAEAVRLFLSVAGKYKAAGNATGEKRAFLGAADSNFKLRQYSNAVNQYNRAVELMGTDKSLEKRWALYMITQSYSKLKKRDMQKEALNNAVAANGFFGKGAEAIYKDDFRK